MCLFVLISFFIIQAAAVAIPTMKQEHDKTKKLRSDFIKRCDFYVKPNRK